MHPVVQSEPVLLAIPAPPMRSRVRLGLAIGLSIALHTAVLLDSLLFPANGAGGRGALFDIGAKPRPLIASIAPKTAAPTPMPKSAPSQSAPRIVRGKTAVLADPKKIDPKPSIEPSTETRLDAPPPESEIFSGEPPPEGPRYYRAGELDERPQPIVLPEPEIADAAGPGSNQAGYLVVQVLINESGTVDRVIFLISDPDGVFDDATTRSFSAARFRPALKNGLAVKSEMIIEIKFASAASPLDAAIQAMQRQRTEKAEN